jgi:dihydrodipicolinate synthase/N-acetylneuraminate lyase
MAFVPTSPTEASREIALLTREERRALLDAVVNLVNGRVPVFASVADPSPVEVAHSALEAKNAGADGIIATPSYYCLQTNDNPCKHFWIARRENRPLVDIEAHTAQGMPIRFTFFWTESNNWEGRDHQVTLT